MQEDFDLTTTLMRGALLVIVMGVAFFILKSKKEDK